MSGLLSFSVSIVRISRTILECKGKETESPAGKDAVLVEPYWNVKVSSASDLSDVAAVLVEPYWNVKPGSFY